MLLLRRINIWVVTYLDDILIMGQMMEKIIQRQCNIPPPAYGFCFKLEMSIMNPVQEIDFLDITINSLKMCLSSPQEKV